MANKSMKFSEALAELEQILKEMESGELGIDDLTSKVKRANQLIDICNKRLRATEEDLGEILGEKA